MTFIGMPKDYATKEAAITAGRKQRMTLRDKPRFKVQQSQAGRWSPYYEWRKRPWTSGQIFT